MLLTDGVEALLDLARTNADRNRALYPEARVDVEAHCWGSSVPPAGQWDLVIGSDLTHLAHGSRLLCLTMRHLLERNACRVILAHQDRAVDGSLAEFVGIATESGMDVTELLVDRDSRGTYPPVPVAILELGLAQSGRRLTSRTRLRTGRPPLWRVVPSLVAGTPPVQLGGIGEPS